MCGRFTLKAPVEKLRECFPLFEIPEIQPRFNIAPTQQILAVRQEEGARPRAAFFRWGLVPSWAKDLKIGASLINARADTVASKPAFRAAFKRRRCLVLADGFYEWPKGDKKGPKEACHIQMADGQPLAFAGLWEHWDGAEPAVDSCTIITTDANELMRPLHDRMPVILEARDFARWLDPAPVDPGLLQEMLRPYPSELMALRPVGTHVNNARNEGPECLTAG
jgi:putative SOS response-associated peptidase YedK